MNATLSRLKRSLLLATVGTGLTVATLMPDPAQAQTRRRDTTTTAAKTQSQTQTQTQNRTQTRTRTRTQTETETETQTRTQTRVQTGTRTGAQVQTAQSRTTIAPTKRQAYHTPGFNTSYGTTQYGRGGHDGLDIRVRFPDWNVDVRFGDRRSGHDHHHHRRERTVVCRPRDRCGHSSCRHCAPPPPVCRPHHPCRLSSCHTCHPPKPVCRVGSPCGLHTCHTCHPPKPVCRVGSPCGLHTCHTCHPPRDARYYYERKLASGWDEIAYGHYKDARNIFECLIDEDPCDPRPHLGLSIAQGLRGKEKTATREMRHAVEIDPKALMSISCDGDLRRRVKDLLCEFEHRLRHDCDDEDDWFMVASLKTILGEFQTAHCAIMDAIRFGDCSTAAYKLKDCLELKVYGPRHRHGNRSGYGHGGYDYGR